MRAASRALGDAAPEGKGAGVPLLPPLARIRDVSKDIAFAVGRKAQEQGHAPEISPDELRQRIGEVFWEPAY
jgi:malate dehydrogenase (oxaloacetate-decarboxylating)